MRRRFLVRRSANAKRIRDPRTAANTKTFRGRVGGAINVSRCVLPEREQRYARAGSVVIVSVRAASSSVVFSRAVPRSVLEVQSSMRTFT